MKRLLLSLVTFLSLGALAGPYAILQNQRNALDSGTINRITNPPASLQDGIYWYDGANQIPDFLLLGTNLSIASGTLNATQVQSDWLASSGPSFIQNKPAIPSAFNPAQSSATRSLNTAFQVSSTRNALVVYAVQITVTASISGGQNGDVILEIASDSGFTTNVQTLAVAGVGQTYTLAIALQGVQPQTSPVMGFVPAGYYTRLRTVNNNGTPGFTYRTGQEVLL